MVKKINSTQNPLVKQYFSLQKPKERERQNLFIAEGLREILLAMKSGYEVKNIAYYPESISFYNLKEYFKDFDISGIEFSEVSKPVFEKISYRNGTANAVALCVPKRLQLNSLSRLSHSLFIVLESVEKPGNLGAILRTADAANISGVIICDTQTDIYNPNVVRSSLGCLFTVPVAVCSSKEAIDWFKKNNIKIFSAIVNSSKAYTDCDFTKPSAVILGSEAKGLSEIWTKNSNESIHIPMMGKVDSMNVSVSAAIIVYEAIRQRH